MSEKVKERLSIRSDARSEHHVAQLTHGGERQNPLDVKLTGRAIAPTSCQRSDRRHR